MQLSAVSLRSFISCREYVSVSRSIKAEGRSPTWGGLKQGISGRQLGETLHWMSFKVLSSYIFEVLSVTPEPASQIGS